MLCALRRRCPGSFLVSIPRCRIYSTIIENAFRSSFNFPQAASLTQRATPFNFRRPSPCSSSNFQNPYHPTLCSTCSFTASGKVVLSLNALIHGPRLQAPGMHLLCVNTAFLVHLPIDEILYQNTFEWRNRPDACSRFHWIARGQRRAHIGPRQACKVGQRPGPRGDAR